MKRRDMLDEEDDVAWGGGTQRMEQDVFEEKTSKEASIVAKVKKSKIRLKRKSSSSACVASSSEFESSGGKSSNEGNPVTEASSDEWAFLGSLSADDVAFSSALNSPPPGKSSSRISQSGREVRKALVISYSEETQVDESRHKDHSLLDVTLMSSADETRPLDHLNVKEAAEAGVFPVAAPPSSYSSSSSSFPGLQLCLRFVAIDVSDDTMQRRKDIRCLSTQSDMVYSSQEGGSHQDSLHHVFVSGHWYDVSISGGDVFHVILLNELSFHNASYGGIMMHKEQAIIVDDTTNLLICFPDLLLSPSKIIDSLLCSRKSLLSSRFPGSLPSSAAVLGSLKHEFIEKVIQQVWRKLGDRGRGKSGSGAGSLVTSEQIGCFIETATHNLRKDLVACGIDQSTAKPELEGVLDNVIDWSRRAFYNMPGEGGTSTFLALKEVIGVEETFTSTVLGMKGAVDLVVAGRRKSEELKSQGNTALEMFPLEIKTGVRKPIALIGHRAQVILYVLALRIRHLSSGGVSINTHLSPSSGILLYVHSEKTESELVTPSWTDIRQLMIARNALAMYTTVVESHGHSLPPMLMSPGDCARCFQASECMVVHKAIEGGSPTSSGASDLFEYSTKHLSDAHLDYFHHWLRLVDMEAGAMDSKFSPWAQSGHQREQKGENCMSGWSAIMINEVDSSEGSFCMILTRQLPPSQSPRSSVDPLRLAVDDRVLLSAEVQRSTTRDIEDTTCLSDKAFSVVDVEACLAVGRVGSITSVRAEILLSKMSSRLQSIAANGFLLRLDKEESGYSVGSMRTNLRRLVSSPFVPGNFNSASMKKLSPMIQSDKMDSRTSTGDENLRLMIIDFRAPFFVSVYENGMEMFCPRSVTLAFFQSAAPGMEVHRNSSQIQNIGGLLIYPGCNPLVLYEEFLRLNSDQKNAVKRLLSAEHYVLILGAPG